VTSLSASQTADFDVEDRVGSLRLAEDMIRIGLAVVRST
jgi:hypothetical protein